MEDYIHKIKRLRIIDDDFMSIFFNDNIECTKLVLNIILNRDDLKVSEVKTQKEIKNIQGRAIRLDIYASDSTGVRYDVEIQREDKGANLKRARYHSSMVDANMLKPGESFSDLRENYIIFITENDVIGMNEPIYHINRFIEEGNVHFNDGEHIIYVNGSIKTTDTALGRLMSDFYCTEADKMYYKELSDKIKYYKESEKGVTTMCEIWEEIRNEGIMEGKIELATNLIKDGAYSLEKIAELTGISIDKIRELAGNLSA